MLINNFKKNLRRRIDRGDLSVTELARKANVHRVTVYKILAGAITPSLAVCESLAKAAGIPGDEMFQKNRPHAP